MFDGANQVPGFRSRLAFLLPVLHGFWTDGGPELQDENARYVQEEEEVDEIGQRHRDPNANPEDPLIVIDGPAMKIVQRGPKDRPNRNETERHSCNGNNKVFSSRLSRLVVFLKRMFGTARAVGDG